MQRFLYTFLCLTACCILFTAGCISPSGPSAGTAVPATTAQAAGPSLVPLALSSADLPAGFTLVSARYKSANEVSSRAIDLGWLEGYTTTSIAPANGTSGNTTITQTITVYNTGNVSDLIGVVSANEKRQPGFGFAMLEPPSDIPGSSAISAVVLNTSANTSSSAGAISPGQDSSAQEDGFAEIIFGKGQVFEVIRMTGPGAQYDTLKNLSETAYAKLG